MDETVEELELETLEVETMIVEPEDIVVLTPEQLASRKRAHEIKVANFLSGGNY